MAKLTLSDITSGYQTATAYNANNALIEAALENTLSRDGTTPNQMSADIDLNTYDLDNVGTLNATSLILNGVVVSSGTAIATAIDAPDVSFTPTAGSLTTLQDALDDDYVRNDQANTLVGNQTITGNLAVSGTVDGVDIATSIAALQATVSTAAVAGHIRAGSTQLVDGSVTAPNNPLDVDADLTVNTWESVGPTGSGATNIWTDMDSLPSNATILLCNLTIRPIGNSTGQANTEVFAASGDVTASASGDDTLISNIGLDCNDAASPNILSTRAVMIPLGPTNQDFQLKWNHTSAASSYIELTYRGFMTD